jgi:hypothetical protein
MRQKQWQDLTHTQQRGIVFLGMLQLGLLRVALRFTTLSNHFTIWAGSARRFLGVVIATSHVTGHLGASWVSA